MRNSDVFRIEVCRATSHVLFTALVDYFLRVSTREATAEVQASGKCGTPHEDDYTNFPFLLWRIRVAV